MSFLLEKGHFHCYVRLPECNPFLLQMALATAHTPRGTERPKKKAAKFGMSTVSFEGGLDRTGFCTFRVWSAVTAWGLGDCRASQRAGSWSTKLLKFSSSHGIGVAQRSSEKFNRSFSKSLQMMVRVNLNLIEAALDFKLWLVQGQPHSLKLSRAGKCAPKQFQKDTPSSKMIRASQLQHSNAHIPVLKCPVGS